MIVSAVVPAAGKGSRLKSKTPKPFIRISGKPLLVLTLLNLKKTFRYRRIVVPVDPARQSQVQRLLKAHGLGGVQVVAGGKTRAQSVKNGIDSLGSVPEFILVHDAARPLVTPALIKRILNEAARTGGAICAVPATATVKRVRRDFSISATEDRDSLYLAQTPQVFRKKDLLGRYKALKNAAFARTDEASLFDGSGVRIRVVPGESRNIKITTPEDLALLNALLGSRKRGR